MPLPQCMDSTHSSNRKHDWTDHHRGKENGGCQGSQEWGCGEGEGMELVFFNGCHWHCCSCLQSEGFTLLLLSNLIWILPNQILVRLKLSKNVRWYGCRSVHRYPIGELILSEGGYGLGGVCVSNYYSSKQQKLKIWLIMSGNKLIATVPKLF